MLIIRIIVSAWVYIFLFQQAEAQTADEIVKKYIEAIGGYERIKGIRSMIFEGTLSFPIGNEHSKVISFMIVSFVRKILIMV